VSEHEVVPNTPRDGDPVELALAPSPHRAFVATRDDGDGAGPYRLLEVEVGATGSLGLLTVAFQEPSDLALAVRIANTLKHASD
jgi:hypothetical protein